MTYTYTVTVEAETRKEADEVIAERLGHDEDYGFDYTISVVPVVDLDEYTEQRNAGLTEGME